MTIIDSPDDLVRALASPLPACVQRILGLRADLIDLATFVIPAIGDDIAAIERSAGIAIATDAENDTRYGEPGFLPSFEWVLDHGGAYEAPFILSDDGAGVVLIVPDDDRIDPTLLALLRAYAERAACESVTVDEGGCGFTG